MLTHPVARWIATTVLVSAASPLVRSSSAVEAPIPGYTCRTHTTTTNSNPAVPANMAGTEMTATVTWAAGRARMDVVDGAMTGMIVGDYTLVDSTDYLTVHPADKSFSAFPVTAGDAMKKVGLAAATAATQKITSASLDLLGAEVIDGQATRHYRTNVVVNVTIDLSGALAGLDISDLPPEAVAALAPTHQTITMSTEQWLAEPSAIPPAPMGSMQQFARSMATGELADSLSSLHKRIPAGRPVRTISRIVSSTTGPVARTDTTVTTIDMSAPVAAEVDPDRLTLPADYTQKAVAGLEALGIPLQPVDVAKWRRRP